MDFDHRPQKRLIFGMSGTGKTTLFLRLLANSGHRWKFVFDADLEAARKLHWQAASTIEGLAWLYDHEKPVMYWPGRMYPADYEAGLDFFCRFTLNLARSRRGAKLFAADELQEVTEPGPGGIPDSLREMLNVGRREEIDFLLAAQSANDVHSRIRRQLTELYVFRAADSDTPAFQRLAKMGIDAAEVQSLPHPSQGRVGYLYRQFFTGKTERVEFSISPDASASLAAKR